jgi:2-polyprenyl-6-methoxyphenol hydroxylase-like FAD-dependent oxidoreductase
VARLASLPRSVQVLVAGGGPVGLAAAVELGRRGVSCLVIEPREEVSHARPRCKTVNVRTMEHLRRWGIADRFRAAAPLPVSWSKDIVFCTSLAGYELSRFTGVLGLALDGDRFPETGQQAPQYVLEELLRDVVTELPGCDLATGLRVTSVEQDPDAVRVTVQDRAGGQAIIEAEYVLGCDGPRSTVRDQIGASYVGELALRPNFGMVFHAPGLWPQVRHGPAVQFWVVNDRTPALMGPMDRNGTWWIIALGVPPELGRRTAVSLIEGAAGVPVDARILSDDPWTARMQLVDRLRSGRVFLAGDAAHLNPPFGGHGLNTGIGDAVDLGWKLAAVLHGWGGEELLASYEAERRPVQDRVIREASENMKTLSTDLTAASLEDDTEAGQQARRAAGRRIQQDKAAEFHALDLVLDLCYDPSPLIVPGPHPAPHPGPHLAAHPGPHPAPHPGPHLAAHPGPHLAAHPGPQPGARPGARLPHVWLGPTHSVYDSLGPGMTLLVLDAPAGSWQPLVQAASKAGVPLDVLDLRPRGLRQRYGAGLLLVRPDQHVAWCADALPADPAAIIDRVRGARHDGPEPAATVARRSRT